MFFLSILIQQYFSASCVGLLQVTIVRDFPSERIVNQLLDTELFSWFTIALLILNDGYAKRRRKKLFLRVRIKLAVHFGKNWK